MLGTLLPSHPVTIYGAGFAGLVLAFRLKKSGVPFTLYEKNRVGGKIATTLTDLGPAEAAASTLYMNAAAEEFIKELNLPYLVSTPKLKKRIWKEDGLHCVFSFKLLLNGFLSIGKRFPKIREDSTVEEIFHPLLGQDLIDELLSPALQGIHAAEARELHFLSLFPFAKEQNFKSYLHFFKVLKKNISSRKGEIKGSISFPGGMQTLINALYEEVKEHIEPVPELFSLKPNTVICTDALDAAELLSLDAPEISRKLKKIQYRPITSFTIFQRKEITELHRCFGILIPQKYKRNILGLINQSALFPENYKAHCYNSINKGILNEEEALSELKAVLPNYDVTEIIEDKLTQWEKGLPLFDYNRHKALETIRHILSEKPGLMLFGNYTKGISLRAMIEESTSVLQITDRKAKI